MLPTVLLTGARGFIGRAIARALATQSIRTVGVTSRGEKTAIHGCAFVETVDLMHADAAALDALLARNEITHCIHAAWYTDHADYLTSPVNKEWLAAGRRLADTCAARGVRLAALGTCAEYEDDGRDNALDEENTAISPNTLYARCKATLWDYIQTTVKDSAWIRIFYVYGPGDRTGRLIPHFMSEIAAGRLVTPRFGALRRDFIHVDDLGHQVVGVTFSAFRGSVNCATGVSPTLDEIAAATAVAMGWPDRAGSNSLLDPMQPSVVRASISRLGQIMGDVPARRIEQGLIDTVATGHAEPL